MLGGQPFEGLFHAILRAPVKRDGTAQVKKGIGKAVANTPCAPGDDDCFHYSPLRDAYRPAHHLA
jgi:hypothetical protein